MRKTIWPLFLFFFSVGTSSGGDFSWGNSRKYPSGADQCFCKLEGRIDDCLCKVGTVDYFNNKKVFPRLMSLLGKDYFRYFQYNAMKPCPFWNMKIGKCASRHCGVSPCDPQDLPPGLAAGPEVHDKYSVGANKPSETCSSKDDDDEDEDAVVTTAVDDTISEDARESIKVWKAHDDSVTNFCDIEEEESCPDCQYVDLTLNPERYTGYAGEDSHRIWRTIYEENCFRPPNPGKGGFSAAFLQDRLEDLCLEKRAFYRAVSGLHSSITIHLTAKYPLKEVFVDEGVKWGPNLLEFLKRFDPQRTNDQGPYWLKNLYFVYLLEMRALSKAAFYLENQPFFTGNSEEDKETQIAVKEVLNLLRSFPDHFDETTMFTGGAQVAQLKEEFRAHFHNITRVMDCVSCDKCKLWGKLQITGLGTSLKILFSEVPQKEAEIQDSSFQLSRNEIVALFNAFGKISTSIQEIERFREMMRTS